VRSCCTSCCRRSNRYTCGVSTKQSDG
jgi:hypothetical protein